MQYYFEKTTNYDFDKSVQRITEELKIQGFGILAEIDMKKTLKEKINVDFIEYKILEACNPPFAYKSLMAEENIGIMLPCNIVIKEKSKNLVTVSVVNPVSAMQGVNNPKMDEIANEIQLKLRTALSKV